MDFEKAFDIRSIQLEPRLQEYIRKKKFNKENNIMPEIPEEQEFCITKQDLQIIKKYKQGKSRIYTSNRLSKQEYFVKPIMYDFDNTENDFKKDPRYKRLQKKMESHRIAQDKIRNFDNIDSDYEIFHRSNPYDKFNKSNKSMKIAKPYYENNDDDISYGTIDDSIMMDSRDLVLGPSRPIKNNTKKHMINRSDLNDFGAFGNFNDYSNKEYCYNPNKKANNPNTYNHPPKIAYNDILTPQRVNGGLEHNSNINDIIGDVDNYNRHLNKTYEYIDPTIRTNTRKEHYNRYQSVPFMYGNGLPDVCLEDSLRGGIRDSSKKSIGFKNPFENQFYYISKDISDPNHTVQMWPNNTRGTDKQIARVNSKAVKSELRLRNEMINNNYNNDIIDY